jgi:hypothetical protein
MGYASRIREVDLRVIEPRDAPEPSIATRTIRDAFRSITEDVVAQGVLFGDRPRLLVDLAPRAPIRDPLVEDVPLYTSSYFLGLVGHPNLNPLIVERLEQELGDGRLADLLEAVRPWYSLDDDFQGQRLGPIGCSGLFFSVDTDGTVHFLIGRRSRTCAVSTDAWTTTLDEGIANLVGWHAGQLRNAVVQELGLEFESRDRFLTTVRHLGWLIPALRSERAEQGDSLLSINGHVLQSGANAVFGSMIAFDELLWLADRYNAEQAESRGQRVELSEYAVWSMDEIVSRDDVFTEVLVSGCKAVVDQVDRFRGDGP